MTVTGAGAGADTPGQSESPGSPTRQYHLSHTHLEVIWQQQLLRHLSIEILNRTQDFCQNFVRTVKVNVLFYCFNIKVLLASIARIESLFTKSVFEGIQPYNNFPLNFSL